MKSFFTLLLVCVLCFQFVFFDTAQPGRALLAGGLSVTDDFGYTLIEDTTPWITKDTNLGVASGNLMWGPVDLGFTFKFYGRTYTQVYVTSNGLIGLNSSADLASPVNTYMPKITFPNNIIAPFWLAFKSGTVGYKTGGSAPNRYLAVEFNNVEKLNNGGMPGGGTVWFEVILYESGDIWFKYFTLPSIKDCNAGIEDETGSYGLSIDCNILTTSTTAGYRFIYPPAAARVRLTLPQQSGFGAPGASVSFPLTILNAGDIGSDRFDISVTAAWNVSLYQLDGTTPLTDTDVSGKVDTGALPQNSSTTIMVKVAVPTGAGIGDYSTALIEATSKLNSAVKKTASIQIAVAASFAQIFRDNANNAVQLQRLEPGLQAAQKVTPDGEKGSNLAVAEMPGGNLAFAWTASRTNANGKFVTEVKFGIRDRAGGLVKDATRLSDYSAATTYDTDSQVGIAVTPEGQVGLIWQNELWNYNNFTYNPNIYFAILNPDGSVALAPTSLTANTVWYGWNAANSIKYQTPTIAAASDNRFLLGWQQNTWLNFTQALDDIYLASRTKTGAAVGATLKFTNDTSTSQGYGSPSLAALNGGLALLCWNNLADQDIHYAVFDSSLGVFKADTNLSGDAGSVYDAEAHAVLQPNGNILAAWTAAGGLRYAFLDNTYKRSGGVHALNNPLAPNGNTALSVTTDQSSRGILTWLDFESIGYYTPNRPHLYYALLDSNGSVLTPPMFLQTSNYNVDTSFSGYGNTTHASNNADVYVSLPGVAGNAAGGKVWLPVQAGNQGLAPATSVIITITLNASLVYLQATPTPTGVANGGHTLTWNLGAFAPGGSSSIQIQVKLPSGALGARYLVSSAIVCAEKDANPNNNNDSADIVVSKLIYLPAIKK